MWSLIVVALEVAVVVALEVTAVVALEVAVVVIVPPGDLAALSNYSYQTHVGRHAVGVCRWVNLESYVSIFCTLAIMVLIYTYPPNLYTAVWR